MLNAEALPIGPLRLGVAMRSASACLDMIPEHRVLLYRTFDRVAANAIGAFYEAVNTYLIDQRILRHLRVQAPSLKHADRPAAAAAPTEQTSATAPQNASPATSPHPGPAPPHAR